jgi:hypothetical protein
MSARSRPSEKTFYLPQSHKLPSRAQLWGGRMVGLPGWQIRKGGRWMLTWILLIKKIDFVSSRLFEFLSQIKGNPVSNFYNFYYGRSLWLLTPGAKILAAPLTPPTYPQRRMSRSWVPNCTSFVRDIYTAPQGSQFYLYCYSDTLIPELRNTAHRCSRHGPAAAWLTSARPRNVMSVPQTSTLFGVAEHCLPSSQRSITLLIIMSLCYELLW